MKENSLIQGTSLLLHRQMIEALSKTIPLFPMLYGNLISYASYILSCLECDLLLGSISERIYQPLGIHPLPYKAVWSSIYFIATLAHRLAMLTIVSYPVRLGYRSSHHTLLMQRSRIGSSISLFAMSTVSEELTLSINTNCDLPSKWGSLWRSRAIG